MQVVPILTRYEGVSDCFSTILQEEGVRGLFKGFGAVLLQYAAHFLIIKFSSKIISAVAQLLSNTPRLFPPSEPGVGAGPGPGPGVVGSQSPSPARRGNISSSEQAGWQGKGAGPEQPLPSPSLGRRGGAGQQGRAWDSPSLTRRRQVERDAEESQIPVRPAGRVAAQNETGWGNKVSVLTVALLSSTGH